jgi:hypothetical protein
MRLFTTAIFAQKDPLKYTRTKGKLLEGTYLLFSELNMTKLLRKIAPNFDEFALSSERL